MAPLYRAFGILAIVGACISAVLGLLSLPPGGLMFALPYFFFALAIALGVVGGVCVVLARGLRGRPAVDRSSGLDRDSGLEAGEGNSGGADQPADPGASPSSSEAVEADDDRGARADD
jgi:hypothetical protein